MLPSPKNAVIAKTTLAALLMACGLLAQTFPLKIPLGLPKVPCPDDNPLTPKSFDLGKQLFFDPILSADRQISCASCHQPGHGFSTSDPQPLGVYGRRALRHAPTLYNRGYGLSHRWDGLTDSLEQQVLLPIEDPNEMDLQLDEAVARIAQADRYPTLFLDAYGEGVSESTLSRALASFVRGLMIGDSPIDRFQHGDRKALSRSELAGMWIYESKGGCWRCHTRPFFTDEKFHNTGIGVRDGKPEAGRSMVTNDAEDSGKFKTPTLRGLSDSAPYMHDGSLATLADVVEFYRRGGNANATRSASIQPLDLSDVEASNLLAFLSALSRQARPATLPASLKK